MYNISFWIICKHILALLVLMKVYDKEIYQKQESIKYTVIIIIVFLLGFVAGYFASSFSNNLEPKTNNEIKIEKIN